MPELPEVETIRRDLEKELIGLKIKDVKINVPKVIKDPTPQTFRKEIVGKEFQHILRRGKNLILTLSASKQLLIHLKMTGQLIYGDEQPQSRVCFILSNGRYLNFNDVRLFGSIRLVSDWEKAKGIADLGPEPLEADFTFETFKKILSGKKTKIKPLLMDQSFIAGIGNIYAQEALFRAGIHPERPASSLRDKEIKDLFSQIRGVLNEAIKYRGSSIDDYVDAQGKKGGFEERLQVYGWEGRSCCRCNTAIKKIELGGRGTCFCPGCQK
ncbi:MAG: DNA-formamidopyrimidine glycosylase [bacterium]